MSEAIRWWLVLQVVAAATLPLCLITFRRLPDRGYALAKPFGLLFLAYLFWLLNSLHVVPNSAGGIIFSLLILVAVAAAFAYASRDELIAWARDNWQYVLGVEVLLLVVFAVAVWLRSQVGATSITEQPMDMMFVNAATSAEHFPPKDPWLSGHTVSYYYFGYLIVAMTGRFAGVAPEIGYNLGFATTATLALIGAAGIVYNLVRLREAAVVEDIDPQAVLPPRPQRQAVATSSARSARPARAVRPEKPRVQLQRSERRTRSLYQVLGVREEATDSQIRSAYQSLARECAPELNPGDRAAAERLAEATTAYAVLSDPEQRRAYDSTAHAPEAVVAEAPAAVAPAPTLAQTAKPDPPIAPEAPTNGAARSAGLPPTTEDVAFTGARTSRSVLTLPWKPAVFGLAGGLMLVVMGNLVALVQFMSAYSIGGKSFYDWINVSGVTSEPRDSWYPSRFFGFFSASRIYPLDNSDSGRVITEFPMFSFVLGDLHPHVMALPFVLLAVGAALALYRSEEPLDITFWLERPLMLVAVAIMLGALAFLNTWDIATLAFFVVAAAAVSNFLRVRRFTVDLAVQVASFALPLLILAVIAYIPFYSSFTSQASGIAAVVSNDAVKVPATRPLHALLFWGPLFVVVVPFVFARLIAARERIARREILLACAAPVVVLVAWVIVFTWENLVDSGNLAGADGLATQISDRGTAWITDFAFGGLLAASLLALWTELTSDEQRREREAVIFALLLSSTAMLLILGTEFFYVTDVFNSRMNTVFKLYYQAWLMLALAGGFSLYYMASHWRFTFRSALTYRRAWAGAAAVVLLAAALYPLGMTFNRVKPYSDSGQRQTVTASGLDGLNYLSPDERAGIDKIRDLSDGQDVVIAEAVAGDYTAAGRISAATGAPAILGWGGHEDQWRGGTTKARAGRFEDVTELYKTTDTARMDQILKKYGVTYIYVGDLERQTYGAAGVDKFKTMPVVFQQGTVTIYRATSLTGEVASAQ